MTEDRDTTEFVSLMTQHQRRLLSYILTLTPQWNDAEDILQRTNIRLWEERARFERGSNFPAWATKVAYFEVLSWRKTASRNRLVFDDELVGELAMIASQASEEARSRRAAALAVCVSELPKRQRDMLRACYGEQSKAAEMASRTGKSVSAIYKAIQRLRGALHRCVRARLAQEEP